MFTLCEEEGGVHETETTSTTCIVLHVCGDATLGPSNGGDYPILKHQVQKNSGGCGTIPGQLEQLSFL
jgi:hypothetical protein